MRIQKYQRFGEKAWRKETTSRNLGTHGRIILKWIFRIYDWEGVDWIDLSQDRNMWQALVDMVMNLQVPQNAGNFLTSRGKFNFSSKVLLHGDLIIHEITHTVPYLFIHHTVQW